MTPEEAAELVELYPTHAVVRLDHIRGGLAGPMVRLWMPMAATGSAATMPARFTVSPLMAGWTAR